MGFEIRLHGRGGQGGVTCAKILAAVYARLGRSVQSFGDYAGERSGAPVRAYTRVGEAPITNRNKVYHPDHLLVLDPTLLGSEVVSGLASGGLLLLNTPRPVEAFAGEFEAFRIAVVDATAIARGHGIGTRSVVIVNTTMAGAFCRAMEVPLEQLQAAFAELGLLSNFGAATQAFEAVSIREAVGEITTPTMAPPTPTPQVLPLTEHRESPPSGLRTGSWRTQRPIYTEHLAPCNAWCPAGNDVVGYLQSLATEGVDGAARVLQRTQPLAAVCGRVCPAPCMEGCNRREVDGEVNIRALERWIGDHADGSVSRPPSHSTESDPKRVAIVGGGPAGLAAAFTLAGQGHSVTIYESEPQLGGVLRTGIPSYRLPRDVLDREVDAIVALGVEARCGERLTAEKIADLAAGFDAVILATGLQRLRELPVVGRDRDGIEQGIHYLARVNSGSPEPLAGHVVVLGGGNTAMDCARSALRGGADRVTVAYRRTEAEMPAIRDEIEEAKEEGVFFAMLRAPVGFHGNGRVEGVELAEVTLGEPDETGRRRPVLTDHTSRLPCERVLLALGQSADLSLLPEGWELRGDRIHEQNEPRNIVAAGDLATGDGTVAHAIGSGRRAAGRALEVCGVAGVVLFERPDRSAAVPITDIRVDHFERRPAARVPTLPMPERLAGFDEVHLGLADITEVERCFACGHCTRCDTCLVYCPEGIIRRRELKYEVDYSFCKGCGICVVECPRSAMEMRPEMGGSG